MTLSVLAHGSVAGHVVMAGVAALATAVYAWRWARSPAPSSVRLAAWAAAVAAVLVSTAPPVERLADERFTWHMVQHLGLIIVAAPLFVLAHPVRLAEPWLGTATRPVRPVRRWVTHGWHRMGALLAAGVFLGVLVITHLTPLYDDAIRHQVLHDAEHIAYLGSAVLLWAAVDAAGRQHAARRIAAVFAVIAGSALLAVVLLTAPRPLVDSYVERLGATRALDDQRAAAAIMWVSGMLTTLPLLVGVFWRWAAGEQRAALRAEELLDRRPP